MHAYYARKACMRGKEPLWVGGDTPCGSRDQLHEGCEAEAILEPCYALKLHRSAACYEELARRYYIHLSVSPPIHVSICPYIPPSMSVLSICHLAISKHLYVGVCPSTSACAGAFYCMFGTWTR